VGWVRSERVPPYAGHDGIFSDERSPSTDCTDHLREDGAIDNKSYRKGHQALGSAWQTVRLSCFVQLKVVQDTVLALP